MKRFFRFYCMIISMVMCVSAMAQTHNTFAQFAPIGNKQMATAGVSAQMSGEATATTTLGPVDNYGFLTGSDGSTWTYTATFKMENNHYSGVEMTIYDNNNEVAGRLNETFELLDTDLWVNTVEINPLVSRRFYNADNNNIEIVLFIHVATKDYKGRFYNSVYTLSPDSSSHVCTINGTQVLAKNIPSFNNERYTMVYFRQEYKGNDLYYNYDVYTRAKYGTNNPVLEHTFEVPYQNIAALNDPQHIYMVENGENVNFFIAQYEKPYFVPGTSMYEDPVVNENNNFVITHYDHQYKVLGETKIPMTKNPDPAYLYTFYYLGSLDGENDIILDYNGTGKAAFVITHDNYEIASDGSIHSFYFYDSDGQLINTIIEESLGTIYLSDVAGYERQYGFMKYENDVEFVQFVDVPSCKTVARIPLYNGGATLSANWDRVAKGSSYQYAVSLLQGNSQSDGTVEQRIAWFTNKGKLDHYDGINLGNNVEYAQVYIYSPVLNPRLFHTDDAYEYLALVKRSVAGSSAKEEVLMLCNNQGQILLELGKDDAKGGALNMIDVINLASNPSLLCVYSANDKYTLNYISLPLGKSQLKGEGTAPNPYQITCVSDFMQIAEHPNAYFDIVNDIDFGGAAFATLTVPFGGKLNGREHKLTNLTLVNGGLFAEVQDTAAIQNLILDKPVMVLTDKALASGFVADMMRGGFSDEGAEYHSLMKNVHLLKPTLLAQDGTGIIGGLIGEASLFTEIVGCSAMDVDYLAPKAELLGGIVGKLATSSSVHASVVSGNIVGGKCVAGIVAEVSSKEPVYDCHVDANLQGTYTIGGVVGMSARSAIHNCFVEGSMDLKTTHPKGNVGGVLGMLEADVLGTSTAIVVENCLVGMSAINVPATNTMEQPELAIHRIVGYSSADSYEYDWDHIDWNKPQSEWPRIYGKAEKCLKNNYVVSPLAALDATIALTDTTTEGANLAASDLTEQWLTDHGFIFGNSVDAPWVLKDKLALWFEVEGTLTDVENVVVTPSISIDNGNLVTEGAIKVYNLNGMLMIQGYGNVTTSGLNGGVYIVTVTNDEGHAAMKMLIP